MTPDKEQLMMALKVFEPWLELETRDAQLAVASAYNSTSTTLPEVAELVGVSRGLSAVAALLRARIDRLP